MSDDKKETTEQELSEDRRLEKLLEEEKRRSVEYLTNLKYLQADFENYSKRADKEMKEIEAVSVGRLVSKLLSVLDELELAIGHAEAEGEHGALLDGLRMVHKNLSSTLEREGLRGISCIGQPFNPELHDAVEKTQGDGQEDIVVEEIRKGFVFRDQVIRPSMVKVKLASKMAEQKEMEASE